LITRLTVAAFALLISPNAVQMAYADTEPSSASPFVGTFGNDQITVALSASSGGYVGTISKGGNQFPAKASGTGQQLAGTFVASNHEYPFTAMLADGGILLVSGGKTYALPRVANNPPSPGAAVVGPTPADVLALRRVAVHDDTAQLDALTLLVPVGWNVQSKFPWRFDHVDPVHPIIRVFNPQGVEAITYYGGNWAFMDWSRAQVHPADGGNTYGITVQTRFATPTDFITRFAIGALSDELQHARLVQATNRPDMVQPALAKYGDRSGLAATVNRLQYEYAVQGVTVQEDVYCTLYTDPPDRSGTVTWSAEVLAFRAGKGKLEKAMGLLLAIKSSAQPDPRYLQVVDAVVQGLHQTMAEAQRQEFIRIQMRNAASQKLGQDIIERANTANAASLKAAEMWDQTIRGVETRVNPIDQTSMEVPSGYSNVFVNPLGEVVLSNDASYNPNAVNATPNGLHGGFEKMGGAQ
jgi:hypothetical protein